MTGFGKASGTYASKNITVEIKSLNSKSFDLSVRLPGAFKEKEMELRSQLNKDLERGKIDFLVYFEQTSITKKHAINQELALAYFQELKILSDAISQSQPNYLNTILNMPGVLETAHGETDEEEWKALKEIIAMALEDFNKFRADEGKELGEELISRIYTIQSHLLEIENLDPQRVSNVRERINQSIAEFVESEKIDKNRFEQELIYYIEKLDITEEKFRLRTHCNYFITTLNEEMNNGKKLGFILQEIGREINTIGSKANDAGVQKLVVQMKDELEKIKEQALNVL
jgi:uncharacterized protein (TIGR00255 family)